MFDTTNQYIISELLVGGIPTPLKNMRKSVGKVDGIENWEDWN